MEASEHFPWTTSMMVFVIDEHDRILLQADKPKRRALYFNTTGGVDIRVMVCDELESLGILTSKECLQLEGVVEHGEGNTFIYTTHEFVTNGSTLPVGMLWYSKKKIPFQRLPDFDKHILTRIVEGEKIGITIPTVST